MNEKKIYDPKKEVKVGVVILNVDEVIKNEIKKFDEAVTEDKLVAAVEGYRGLKIMGIDDKDGYDAVHQARIVLKNMRVEVDKRRKELKADFLKVGNAIEAQAKHLIGILEPTEKYLAEQEKAVDDEVERLKKEAKEKAEKERRDKIEGRVARLREIGFTWGRDAFYDSDGGTSITMVEIEELSNDDFNAFHFIHKTRYNEWLLVEEKHKAEQERARQEEELARKAEAERLAKERAELEVLAKARKLEEEQLAKKQAELDKLSERLAENHKMISSNSHSAIPVVGTVGGDGGRVPIGAIKPEDLSLREVFMVGGHDIYAELDVIKITMGHFPFEDEFLDVTRKNVITLIGKTQTYISDRMKTWQANQKSTKQTK